MNPQILNRNFQHPTDGWYMIEPKGRHANRAAGVTQVIDESAAESIATRFNAAASAAEFPGLLIDHEHFSDDPDKETVAYGWLQKLENRVDGIYGQIRWTATGQKAVDGGDYRFFSTEYAPGSLKVLNDGQPHEVRPLQLDGLSLTNKPNNQGGKPITNRGGANVPVSRPSSASPQKGGGTATHFPQRNPALADQPRKNMKSVCTLLGLSADASEEAVYAEVSKLRNRASTLETELTPLQHRVTELEAANHSLLDDQLATDLDGRGIKDDHVRNRLLPVLKSMKNREERVAFLKEVVGLSPSPGVPSGQHQRKLFNRETHAPGAVESALSGQDDKTRVEQAEREILDYRVKNRCSYDQARRLVRASKPELFTSHPTQS